MICKAAVDTDHTTGKKRLCGSTQFIERASGEGTFRANEFACASCGAVLS